MAAGHRQQAEDGLAAPVLLCQIRFRRFELDQLPQRLAAGGLLKQRVAVSGGQNAFHVLVAHRRHVLLGSQLQDQISLSVDVQRLPHGGRSDNRCQQCPTSPRVVFDLRQSDQPVDAALRHNRLDHVRMLYGTLHDRGLLVRLGVLEGEFQEPFELPLLD